MKFGVLVSFFTKGKNQEEGSNAINVERRIKFEGLVSLINNATPISNSFIIFIMYFTHDMALITT